MDLKILQICHKMPYPPTDGGSQSMHFTAKGLLSNGIAVKTLAINPTRNFVSMDLLPADYIANTSFECVTVDTAIKPFQFFINYFKKESYFTERFNSLSFELKIKQLLQEERFDIVQLEHLYLCKYIATIKRNTDAKIVLRPQNVEHIIWKRYLVNIRNPLKRLFLQRATERLKRFEQSVIEELDGIIALTKEDADLFSSFINNVPVVIVPLGYDYEKIEKYDFNQQFNQKPVVYHLGSMDWMPNIEAIEWFTEFVIPHLEKKQFSAKLIIAGRKMPLKFFQYKSNILDIVEEVDNALEFQEDKQIMIVPLLSGSGIRAKIIEGLALGKTIISTSIGAQGIDYEHGQNILIADTPAEFANQIINCVNSKELCMTISRNARDLSMRKYHYQNTAKKMIDFYKILLNTRNE